MIKFKFNTLASSDEFNLHLSTVFFATAYPDALSRLRWTL